MALLRIFGDASRPSLATQTPSPTQGNFFGLAWELYGIGWLQRGSIFGEGS